MVMVAGSAHLDILARSIGRDDALDRIGNVAIEVGGTACNIAINLVNSGVQAKLLTAMNKSPYSKVIVEYLRALNISPCVHYNDSLPTGGFSAHINTEGELVSAVSSMPVDQAEFAPENVEQAMQGASAVVLDCNLSVAMLNLITGMANAQEIPVYVSAVSEPKAPKIGLITGRIKGIFLNAKEYQSLCDVIFDRQHEPERAAQLLQTHIVMTEGARGVTLAFPDNSRIHIPPPALEHGGSRLGMGDALAAGVVLQHEIRGFPFVEAAQRALDMVSRVSASAHCHPGTFGAFETAIDRVQHDAGHDALTGLLNRRLTEQALSEVFERRRTGHTSELAVLMIDIDHFKSINDTYGHDVGDEVIVHVSQTMRRSLRDTDCLGRWGGEEFVIVLPNTTREGALIAAERIRAAVEQHQRHPRVTISVGCVWMGQGDIGDHRTVVGLADKALYEAKHTGRNRVVCAE